MGGLWAPTVRKSLKSLFFALAIDLHVFHGFAGL